MINWQQIHCLIKRRKRLLGSLGDGLLNGDLDAPKLARCLEVWAVVDLARLTLLARETCMTVW